MNDDTSNIVSGGCNVLTASGSLSNYNGRYKRDYTFNGGRWILYRTQTSSYNDYDISSYNCISLDDLRTNSIYEPFLMAVAFGLVVVTILLFKWSVRGILGRY